MPSKISQIQISDLIFHQRPQPEYTVSTKDLWHFSTPINCCCKVSVCIKAIALRNTQNVYCSIVAALFTVILPFGNFLKKGTKPAIAKNDDVSVA